MSAKFKLAYYNKEDWDKFLEIIDDRESMYDTWELWLIEYMKLKNNFQSQGYIVEDTLVDLDKLSAYCKKRNIKNDSKARSEFVSGR